MADQTGEHVPWLSAATCRPNENPESEEGLKRLSWGASQPSFPLQGPGRKAHQASTPLKHTHGERPQADPGTAARADGVGGQGRVCCQGPLSPAGLGVGGAFPHLPPGPELQTSSRDRVGK